MTGILHWLRLKTCAGQKVQRAGVSSFEPLEPRVLLSADLAGVQPVLTCETVPTDQAIYVDLNDQAPEKQQELLPVLTLEALPGAGTSQPKTEDETLSTPELEPAGQPAVELFRASPALFVENQGQWSDSSIRYVHDGSGVDVAVTDLGVVFRAADTDLQLLQFSASFVGASAVRPVGREPSASLFNYYVGDPAHWRQSVPSYERVAYEGLYEGIDLRIQGLRSHIKYEFHVAPGADYRRIAVRYEGIEGLSLGEDGALQVNLGAGRGVIRDDAPYIYQEIGGQKMTVAGRFVLLDDRTYSFEITGPIDPDHALVIDPDLVWSTYLGGGDSDSGYGIAVDGAGDVYVTGGTSSDNWTNWISGGFDTIFNGPSAFVAKLSSSGTHVWSTYVDGNPGVGIAVDTSGNVYMTGTGVVKLSSAGAFLWRSSPDGSGVAVDASGNVYVTGTTSSSGWVSGGFDTIFDGPSDAFVAKLSSEGAPLWSTYLGGDNSDSGASIAVDASGVYVTGTTNSSNNWTSNGFDTSYNGGAYDVFVVKLSSSGEHLWSTYLGGSDDDQGGGIAVDISGAVYVTGATQSAGWTSGGFGTTYNGGRDVFVVKLSSDGQHLWSTYWGGDTQEWGHGIAVGTSDGVYVTGEIQAFSRDAFVIRINFSGSSLWSTYLGGSGDDSGYGVAVDAFGKVYVTGETGSSGWTSGGFDLEFNGGSNDVFVAKFADLTPPTIDAFSVSPPSVPLGGRFMVSYTVSDTGGSGLNSVQLWRTNDLNTWQSIAQNSASTDGPVTGGLSDVPPAEGDWWYGLRVFDTAGNWAEQMQPIHVVVTPPDLTPPSPNPSQWAVMPHATSATSIQMAAMTATDDSGVEYYVEYYFDETTGNPGATDSGWQDSNTYEDTGLFPSTTYVYQVKTRDKSPSQNETDFSSQASAMTDADITPPIPSPSTWVAAPYATGIASVFMVATMATDVSGVEYYFDETSGNPGGTDSGWQDSNVYEDTGLSTGTVYTYVVRTRDRSTNHNVGVDSAEASVTTPTPVYRFWSAVWQRHFYTIKESEKNKLIEKYSDVWTDFEGVAYYAFAGATDPIAVPVYRFWSAQLRTHFYTMSETERDKLRNQYPDVWQYEGPAFYTYSKDVHPMGTSAVYRFWSGSAHFYTIDPAEYDKLRRDFVAVWTYELIAWYAYPRPSAPA